MTDVIMSGAHVGMPPTLLALIVPDHVHKLGIPQACHIHNVHARQHDHEKGCACAHGAPPFACLTACVSCRRGDG